MTAKHYFQETLGDNDVLLGRGTGPNTHCGNRIFRLLASQLVSKCLESSSSAATSTTTATGGSNKSTENMIYSRNDLARKLVALVHARKGRFVRKLTKDEVKSVMRHSSAQHENTKNKNKKQLKISGKDGRRPTDLYVTVPYYVAVEKAKQSFRHQLNLLMLTKEGAGDDDDEPLGRKNNENTNPAAFVPLTSNPSTTNIDDDDRAVSAAGATFTAPSTSTSRSTNDAPNCGTSQQQDDSSKKNPSPPPPRRPQVAQQKYYNQQEVLTGRNLPSAATLLRMHKTMAKNQNGSPITTPEKLQPGGLASRVVVCGSTCNSEEKKQEELNMSSKTQHSACLNHCCSSFQARTRRDNVPSHAVDVCGCTGSTTTTIDWTGNLHLLSGLSPYFFSSFMPIEGYRATLHARENWLFALPQTPILSYLNHQKESLEEYYTKHVLCPSSLLTQEGVGRRCTCHHDVEFQSQNTTRLQLDLTACFGSTFQEFTRQEHSRPLRVFDPCLLRRSTSASSISIARSRPLLLGSELLESSFAVGALLALKGSANDEAESTN